MAKTYSNSELCEIFKADWTENPTFNSGNLLNSDFMKSFQMRTVENWQNYVNFFKDYLIANNGSFIFSNDFNASIAKLDEDCSRFEILIEKSKILELLKFLKTTRCNAIKLCFGINSTLGRGGFHKILATGSYQENVGTTADEIVDNLLKINGEKLFFSNLDLENILSEKEAEMYNNNFEATITNKEEKRVMGYLIGIQTFYSLLTKDEHLGGATNIRFSLAMNQFDINTNDGQIVLVKIDSPEIEAEANCYYLFDKDLPENDDLDCPPRNPCKPGGN